MKTLIISLLAMVIFSTGATFGAKHGLNTLTSQVKQSQVKKHGNANSEMQILLAQL